MGASVKLTGPQRRIMLGSRRGDGFGGRGSTRSANILIAKGLLRFDYSEVVEDQCDEEFEINYYRLTDAGDAWIGEHYDEFGHWKGRHDQC